MGRKMGRCQDKYFLRLDRGQNISCLQRHIKQKLLRLPNNPFLRYAACKNKMASQDCFLGNQRRAHSPGNLLCSSNIPQRIVPKLTLKWTTGRPVMVKGPSLNSVSKAPLEFRHQSSCIRI